jgi:hypothetical protein
MTVTKVGQRVVSIESPRPMRRSQQEVSPGIIERTTCQLLVRYGMEMPPVFSLSVSRRTALVREFGYAIVGSLEKMRLRLPMFIEQPKRAEFPGRTRKALRSIRSKLAIRLLLPRFQVPVRPLADEEWIDLTSPGFEAARRVFDFRNDGNRVSLIVCHVFSERHDEAANRLLNEFAAIAAKGVEVGPELSDLESKLWLRCAPSARFGARRYWEVIIGLPERFPARADAFEGSGPMLPKKFVQPSLAEVTVLDDDLPMRSQVKTPDARFLREAVAHSALDWDFVIEEIRAAENRGAVLDEQCVQAIARRRLEHAHREFPQEEPGATFESSLDIVRNAVALHELSMGSGGPAS